MLNFKIYGFFLLLVGSGLAWKPRSSRKRSTERRHSDALEQAWHAIAGLRGTRNVQQDVGVGWRIFGPGFRLWGVGVGLSLAAKKPRWPWPETGRLRQALHTAGQGLFAKPGFALWSSRLRCLDSGRPPSKGKACK